MIKSRRNCRKAINKISCLFFLVWEVRRHPLLPIRSSKKSLASSLLPGQSSANPNPSHQIRSDLVSLGHFFRVLRSPMGADGDSSGVDGGCSVTVHIRCSNGSKFSLQTPLDVTIGAFKVVVAGNCDVPAEQQRLIYKGRVLKDEQTLQSYGGFFFLIFYLILWFIFPLFLFFVLIFLLFVIALCLVC